MKAAKPIGRRLLFRRINLSPGARRSFLRDDAGGAIAEFAVILPVLMLVLMGIFTFGAAMNNYVDLTEAVNTGARIVAISRGQTTDPCAVAASAIYNSAPTLSQSNFTFSFAFDGSPFSGASCSSSSTTTGAAGDLVQGTSATVTVTYPCSLEVMGVNYVPSCTLQAETTELVQ
ncbi:MAG: TadE/TadG family type IV pilus assembly protein [Terriglobia bacterium]